MAGGAWAAGVAMIAPVRQCPTHGYQGEFCPQCLFRPGDVLLYSGTGVLSWGIKVKTWSRFSHVEVYDQEGTTVASRDGKGVNRYVFSEKNLRAILRPRTPPAIDFDAGRQWFRTEAIGQPYDWLGLFAFFSARAQGSKKQAMFCSEFAARYFKKCGYCLFFGDSDAIAPGEFWKNPLLSLVWAHPDEPVRDIDW